MAISKMSNGFYSRSDSYLKKLNKKELIGYLRTVEKNWENALITNDIQYHNCKRLLVEERSKAIDEFVKWCYVNGIDFSYMRKSTDTEPFVKTVIKRFNEEQMKAGGKE